MTRTLFIESSLIEKLSKEFIEQAKEDLEKPYYGYSDVLELAGDVEEATKKEMEVIGDDMCNLYIQTVNGLGESFEEIGSWEE